MKKRDEIEELDEEIVDDVIEDDDVIDEEAEELDDEPEFKATKGSKKAPKQVKKSGLDIY